MDKKKEKQSVLQLLFGFMDRANGDHVGAYAAQAAYFLIMSFIPFILFLTTIIRYTPLTYNMVSETIRAFADEKCRTGLQHSIDLPEASGQIRPEIDGFKGRDRIKPILRKNDMLHAALPHHTAPLLNCGSVEASSLLHADGRIIDALDDAPRAFFQKSLDVRPSAAAAVQHLGVRRGIQKLKPPPGHGTVPDIHHSDHELPAKAYGLAGVFKE